jgi:mannitol-1-phosphate 5-dehydrogenase
MTSVSTQQIAKEIQSAGKGIFRLQGQLLGKFIRCLAETNAKDHPEKPIDTVVLGGSLCETEYGQTILSEAATVYLQQAQRQGRLTLVPRIVAANAVPKSPKNIGAWIVQPQSVKDDVAARARKVYENSRVPLATFVDFDGENAKIQRFAIDADGNLTGAPLYRETFRSPRLSTELFCEGLARRLDLLSPDQPYEALDLVVLAAPTSFGVRPFKSGDKEWQVASCDRGLAECTETLTHLHGNNLLPPNGGIAAYVGMGPLADAALYDFSNTASHAYATGLNANDLIDQAPDPSWVEEQVYVASLPNCDAKKLSQSAGNWRQILGEDFVRHGLANISERTSLPIAFRMASLLPDVPVIDGKGAEAFIRNGIDLDGFMRLLAPNANTDRAFLEIDMQKGRLKGILKSALATMQAELETTMPVELRRHSDDFYRIIDDIVATRLRGRQLHFVGVGKSSAIARNLSSIFCNLGILSNHLQLSSANSENLTKVTRDDMVFLISHSGKAAELLGLQKTLKAKGCKLVAISGNPKSELARNSDYFLSSFVTTNPAPVAEAPTTSTTAALAAGSAAAVVASHLIDYPEKNFYQDHPGEKTPFNGTRAMPDFDSVALALNAVKEYARAIRQTSSSDAFLDQCLGLCGRILAAQRRGKTTYLVGCGSSMDVAQKVSATLTSIGVNAFALLPTDIPLGDLGHIEKDDLVVMFSYKGETQSLIRIADHIRAKGADCTLITSDPDSTLAKKLTDGIVLIGEGLDDKNLVTIPNQKILANFVNLAVGDAIAVVLAHLIEANDYKFAGESHPGGAIGRNNKQLHPSTLASLSQGKLEMMPPQDRLFYESYLRRRDFGVGKESLIIGMGAMGLGYLGYELGRKDNALFFVDQNETRIAEMQKLGQYKVQLCPRNNEPPLTIGKVTAIDSKDTDKIAALALRLDHMFVSVGTNQLQNLAPTLASIIQTRYRFGLSDDFNIVFVENFPVDDDSLVKLQDKIKEIIAEPDISVYIDNHVGFVPAVDDALLPEVASAEAPIRRERGSTPLYLDSALWKGRETLPQETPFHLVDNFRALHRRKLWVHNLGHAVTAYLGDALGYTYIHEAIGDPRIQQITRAAMKSSGEALYSREKLWEVSSVNDYIDEMVSRYANPELLDTVSRVGRDPLRKLQPEDRFMGAARYVCCHGREDPNPILLGIAAAIAFAVDRNATKDGDEIRQKIIDHLSPHLAHASRALANAEEKYKQLAQTAKIA